MIWAAEGRVEPDAGWGRIVALALAAAAFYGGREAWGRWVKPLLNRVGRPSPEGLGTPSPEAAGKGAGRGYLYVIAFSTGTVKVGKTRRPDKRRGEHQREVAAFGGSIVDEWLSPAHDGYADNEGRLIDACAREGRQIKREYFAELPFTRARDLAQALVSPGEGAPEGSGRTWRERAGAWLRQPLFPAPPPSAPPPVAAPAPSPVSASRAARAESLPAGAVLQTEQVEVFGEPDPVYTVSPGEHGAAIQDVLNHAGLDATVARYTRGPIASRYELATRPGVSVERIKRVASSIAAACKVDAVQVALVPGRGTVGVDVPNSERELVPLYDVLASAGPSAPPLTLGIGASLDGPVAPNLAKMPHMLIAGASGTGKSTVLNACVLSLLRPPPDRVGLVLVDTKRVELAAYARVPHLALPIVTEARHAAGAFEWLVREVDTRYRSFEAVGVKDMDAFNRVTTADRMRHLVAVVDELADLMVRHREDCEPHIVTIAERGRAAGVHLILATQRPTVGVVTGRIKANVAARLALTTSDKQESRIILDRNGAEALRGDGDALLLVPGRPLTRVQCAFVDDADVEAAVLAACGTADDLTQLRDAARLVVEVGGGSTSMLQSRMRLGWPAARRLLGELEARGVVGPADGNRPRQVLLSADALDAAMRSWG